MNMIMNGLRQRKLMMGSLCLPLLPLLWSVEVEVQGKRTVSLPLLLTEDL